jgi:hypothetical protein
MQYRSREKTLIGKIIESGKAFPGTIFYLFLLIIPVINSRAIRKPRPFLRWTFSLGCVYHLKVYFGNKVRGPTFDQPYSHDL